MDDSTAGEQARAASGDLDRALELARDLAPTAALLGQDSATYLQVLHDIARADLTVARVVEPHLDALAILEQAGDLPLTQIGAGPRSTWGVYAAHSPRHHLQATQDADGRWTLTGTKPWCSLADRVSHAVITAHVSETERAAFAVALRDPGASSDAGTADVAPSGTGTAGGLPPSTGTAGDITNDTSSGLSAHVRPLPEPWVSRGLAEVRSTGLALQDCPAVPVGGPGWYLERPGFAWGGIGVAAVWVGGARGLADALLTAAERRPPDQIAQMHLGACDELLHAAEATLAQAATAIDEGRAVGAAGALLAARVRAVAARTAEEVITRVAHALGPAPLTADEEHARRVADLTVYVRQHHAERDLAALGRDVLQAQG